LIKIKEKGVTAKIKVGKKKGPAGRPHLQRVGRTQPHGGEREKKGAVVH